MKYFVYRNLTIERLFNSFECEFSGYADISNVPSTDRYIWAYMQPYKADNNALVAEIDDYSKMLEITLSMISGSKTVIALTMCDVFSLSATTVNPVTKAIANYNARLYELAETNHNLKVVDFSDFLTKYPKSQWVDWKYYFISQMAINPRIATDFGVWFAQQIDAIELKRKKCLVLDLDNTLWGGILGEDGISGVKIGVGSYPEEAYLYFQQYILELAKSGVILTVCSKNNLEDVQKMWDENPSNLIKEEHLSAFRINWNNKADNIKEIAQELNIGTDSMVFIDDNPTERELVRGMLPEVEVPDFVEHPYQLPMLIKEVAEKYFKIYSVTKEDIEKTEQYKANSQRESSKASFSDFSDYLRSLEIELNIQQVNEMTLERAAQMTQKTNQFNLTTKRYTTSEIAQLIEQGAKAYTLSVKDKFGDSGITGLIIVTFESEAAQIDTLLMSCRVLGKQIEEEFVKFALNELFENQQIQTINATYIPTAKNGQTAQFYEKIGAKQIADGEYIFAKDDLNYLKSDIYQIKTTK